MNEQTIEIGGRKEIRIPKILILSQKCLPVTSYVHGAEDGIPTRKISGLSRSWLAVTSQRQDGGR